MNKYTFDKLTSSQKQIIAERWCSDVAHFTSETSIVEYILDRSLVDSETPFSYDDITNNEDYGLIDIDGIEYQLTESERDEKLEFYEYLRDKAEQYSHINSDRFEALHEKYSEICNELEDLEFNYSAEIYQWFHCSQDACYLLEKAGQCTLDGTFWGRQCCGQSISLDYCIQRIAFEYYTNYGEDYITQDTIEHNRFNLTGFRES